MIGGKFDAARARCLVQQQVKRRHPGFRPDPRPDDIDSQNDAPTGLHRAGQFLIGGWIVRVRVGEHHIENDRFRSGSREAVDQARVQAAIPRCVQRLLQRLEGNLVKVNNHCLARANVGLFTEQRAFSSCFNEVIIPWSNDPATFVVTDFAFVGSEDGTSLVAAHAFFTAGGPELTVYAYHDSGNVPMYSYAFLVGSILLFAVHLPLTAPP